METTQTAQTRAQLLRTLREKLLVFGIAEAEEEANRILENALEITRTELYTGLKKEVPQEAEKRSLKIAVGREKRIPLAYLLGEADFWKETLRVNENCLIPRPETEFLIENVLKAFKDEEKRFSFLDVGTGSGAIAVAILREFQNATGTLLDISVKALEIARTNVEQYKLEERTRLVNGDLFAPFGVSEKWDLIISNPPYLSEADLLIVEPELKTEPKEALDGGKDGLGFYRRIVPEAKKHLNPGGLLVLELGSGQAETVSKWLQDAGYDSIQRFKDYLGIERVLTACFFK